MAPTVADTQHQPPPELTADLTAGWTRWHTARETELRAEHGWLSITAFHWLPDVPTSLPGVPGRWHSVDGLAHLTAVPADGLTLGPDGGTPVDGSATARVDEAGSLSWIRDGRRHIELVRRGSRDAIRVRDPKGPERLAFRGVHTFPVDPSWVIAGRFTAWSEPAVITVETARPDLRQQVTAVGTIEFLVDGKLRVLTATAGAQGRLNVTFTDLTNGRSTAPWRVVTIGSPDENDRVTVDFNRTVNLPFAFTEYGTCPAPVPGNHLPVAVNAGERAPNRVTGPRAVLVW